MVLTAGGSGAGVDLGIGHMMLRVAEETTNFPREVRESMMRSARKIADQPLIYGLAVQLFPLREGDIFLRGSLGSTFNPTVKLMVYVAVSEPSVVSFIRIDRLLDELGGAVSAAFGELGPHLE
jgi:hypothetical protein